MEVERTGRDQDEGDQAGRVTRKEPADGVGRTQSPHPEHQGREPKAGQRMPNPIEGQQRRIEHRWLRSKDGSEQRLVPRHRANRLPVDALVVITNAGIEDERLDRYKAQGHCGTTPPPPPPPPPGGGGAKSISARGGGGGPAPAPPPRGVGARAPRPR